MLKRLLSMLLRKLLFIGFRNAVNSQQNSSKSTRFADRRWWVTPSMVLVVVLFWLLLMSVGGLHS